MHGLKMFAAINYCLYIVELPGIAGHKCLVNPNLKTSI